MPAEGGRSPTGAGAFRQEDFDGRLVADAAVGTLAIVFILPVSDRDLSIDLADEQLPVETVIAESTVKALHPRILPWRARIDVEGLDWVSVMSNPIAQDLGDELRSVIAAYVPGSAVALAHFFKSIDDPLRANAPCAQKHQAESAELVDHAENLEGATVFGGIEDEVAAPDIPWETRLCSGASGDPSAGVFATIDLSSQSFFAAHRLHLFVVDHASGVSEGRRDEAVAVSGFLK